MIEFPSVVEAGPDYALALYWAAICQLALVRDAKLLLSIQDHPGFPVTYGISPRVMRIWGSSTKRERRWPSSARSPQWGAEQCAFSQARGP